MLRVHTVTIDLCRIKFV